MALPDYAHGAQGGAVGHWNEDGSFTWDTGNFAGTTIPTNQAQANSDLYNQSAGGTDPESAAARERASDDFSRENSLGKYEGQGRAGVTGFTDIQNVTDGLVFSGDPGAQLDTQLADDDRARLGELFAKLQQQAATGSGSWENTLKSATDSANRSAQALGQSIPGGGYRSSLRNIGNAQGAISQRAVGQGNILRAQAQMDAQNQLAGGYAGMGAQDIGQAIKVAAARQARRQVNNALREQAGKNTAATVGAAAQSVPYVGGAISAATSNPAGGYSDGGRVPGRARVFGDDDRNDTVPAMLSPGEIVIPRSIVETDSPEAMARFARAVTERHGASRLAYGGPAPWKPGDKDRTAEGGLNWLGGTREPVSIEGGGLLQTSDAEQSRAANEANDALFASRISGQGPTTAPQMLQSESDANIAAAMSAANGGRGRPLPGDILQMFSGQQTDAAGNAASTTAREASDASAALQRSILGQRDRALALADAKQRAAWANTQLNIGIGLQQQAMLRNIFSGASQGLAGLASARGAAGGGGGGGVEFDVGDIQDTGYLPEGGAGPIQQSEPGDFNTQAPDEPQYAARGGVIRGYADGGKVDKQFFKTAQHMRDVKAPGAAGVRADSERRRRENEEEDGDELTDAEWAKMEERRAAKKAAKLGQWAQRDAEKEESAFASAIRGAGDFAKLAGSSLASMVRGYAEGGTVSDVGMDPYEGLGFPYAPMAAPSSVGQLQTLNPAELGLTGGVDMNAPAEFSLALPAPEPVGPMKVGDIRVPPPIQKTLVESPSGAVLEVDAEMMAPLPAGLRLKTPPTAAGAAVPTPKVVPRVGAGATPVQSASDKAAMTAAGLEYEAGAAKAKAEVESAAAQASAMESAGLERKAVLERAQARVEDGRKKFEQAQSDMAKIDTGIDPGRFWATRSTGDRILGIMGLVLGALGAGPDGVNRAALMLNQAIDRDLDAQRTEHELRLKKGAAGVESAQTFYGMARNASNDELAATDLAAGAALDAVAAKGRMMIARTGDQAAKARLASMVAAIEQGSEARKSAGWEKAQDRAIEWAKVDASKARQPGGADLVKQVGELEEREREIQQSGKKLLGLIDKYGTQEKMAPGVEAEMEQAINGMIIASAKMQDREGVVREADELRERKSLGFEPGFFRRGSSAKRAIESYIENADRRRRNAYSVRGMVAP